MAKIISIHVKARDSGSHSFRVDGAEIFEGEDNGLPILNDCIDGSYIDMDIDIETGQIVNWKKPSKKDIIDMMSYDEDEDEDEDEENEDSIDKNESLDKILAKKVELAKVGKLKRQKAEKARKLAEIEENEYYSTDKPIKAAKKEREDVQKIYSEVLKSMMQNTKNKTQEQMNKENEEAKTIYNSKVKGKK